MSVHGGRVGGRGEEVGDDPKFAVDLKAPNT